VFQDHQIPVKVGVRAVKDLAVVACHDDFALRRSQYGCAIRIEQLHTVMGITCATLGRAVAIGDIDRLAPVRGNRPFE
jgi:hypothetical protein